MNSFICHKTINMSKNNFHIIQKKMCIFATQNVLDLYLSIIRQISVEFHIRKPHIKYTCPIFYNDTHTEFNIQMPSSSCIDSSFEYNIICE